LSDPTAEPRLNRTAGIVLVVAIFLLAICGLVYELIAGTLSSYLLGDSVTQFSLVIGIFLTAMGVGSYFSQHIRGNLLTWLVGVELAVGVIGGSTALIGFATFSYTDIYEPVLLVLISAVGVLVGLEIPLVIRILRDLSALRVTLANVLSADYLGALAASVLFPFALLPNSAWFARGWSSGWPTSRWRA
jgi:spermidine synthase